MSSANPSSNSRTLPGAHLLAAHGPAVANLALRLVFGAMVFYVHGLHKAIEFLEHQRTGAAWKLVDEIREMHLPAPFAAAVVATIVQLAAPLFIIPGIFTRHAAFLLSVILAGAVAQNLTAGRDPQLAVLYTLVAATITLWGAPAFSLDARRRAANRNPSHTTTR